jgi:hypothetical protein
VAHLVHSDVSGDDDASRALIKALLVPRDTIPAKMMQTIIVTDRFNHVRRLSIAAFAPIGVFVFSGNHSFVVRILSRRDHSASTRFLIRSKRLDKIAHR